MAKRVSIVIAVWNQLSYTKLTIDHILQNTPKGLFELIIVDNGSKPDVKAYAGTLKDKADTVYIRNDKNLGPIRAINQGIKASSCDYVAAVHNDVLIMQPGWLEKTIAVMDADPAIGIAGFAGRREIYKTGCVNEESLKHNLQNEDLNAPMEEEVSDVAVVDGLFFMMSRRFLDKVGGLDEAYGYMHCYDLDISLASIKNGFRNVAVKVEAMHLGNGGMTRKTRDYKALVKDDYGLLKRNCRIFADKWRDLLPLKVG